MIRLYAVKDLDTGLYLSEVAGVIFARKKYKNYVYDKKHATRVLAEAKKNGTAENYSSDYKNLVIEEVDITTVPFIQHSINKTWTHKIRKGYPSWSDAVRYCALEHVRLFNQYIEPDKYITRHNYYFAMGMV